MIIHKSAFERKRRKDYELIGPETRALLIDRSYQMFAGEAGAQRAALVENILETGQLLRLVATNDGSLMSRHTFHMHN